MNISALLKNEASLLSSML